MPRVDGEFVAPFPPVVPDTTIESAVHNGIVADFVLDANNPRPITAGGTGATSAAAARANLQVERAMQEVTNYDSHVWEAGSFWSSGATGGPDDGIFTGVCHTLGDNLHVHLTARQYGTGDYAPTYIRLKSGGVWGEWVVQGAGQFVDVTGDTMSGALTVPSVILSADNFIAPNGIDFHVHTSGAMEIVSLDGSVYKQLHIANPTTSTNATTKSYVDAADTTNAAAAASAQTQANTAYSEAVAAGTSANNRLLKAGDTMTGDLIMDECLIFLDATVPPGTNNAVSKGYVDSTMLMTMNVINTLTARIEVLERKIK